MNKFKRFLLNCKLTKGICYKYIDNKKKRIKKRKLKHMHKNGSNALILLQNTLSKTGVNFFFDMGTLLGLIREGKILDHDLDIDIAAKLDKVEQMAIIKEELSKIGAKRAFYFYVDEVGIVEESYVVDGIKFDICYYSTDREKDYCYLMYQNPEKKYESDEVYDVVKLTCDSIKEIKTIPFKGSYLNVPNDEIKYLMTRYGEKWNVPDKGYIYWKGPSASFVDYIGKRMK